MCRVRVYVAADQWKPFDSDIKCFLSLILQARARLQKVQFSGGYRHCEGGGLEIMIAREAHENFSPRLLFPLGHAHKTLAIARLSNRNAGFRHFW